MEISRSEVKKMLKESEGKFFGVTFVKKDNSLRKLNGRIGVHINLKGKDSTTKHIDNYVTVYDIKSRGYRTVNIDTVVGVRINKMEYTVK